MPNLIVTCYATLAFLRVDGGKVDLGVGRKGSKGGLERVEGGETAIGIKCMVEE